MITSEVIRMGPTLCHSWFFRKRKREENQNYSCVGPRDTLYQSWYRRKVPTRCPAFWCHGLRLSRLYQHVLHKSLFLLFYLNNLSSGSFHCTRKSRKAIAPFCISVLFLQDDDSWDILFPLEFSSQSVSRKNPTWYTDFPFIPILEPRWTLYEYVSLWYEVHRGCRDNPFDTVFT